MIIVHSGLDGLDFSLAAKAPPELVDVLESAQIQAAETHTPTYVTYNDIGFHVAENGGRGGYAFRFDTGPEGGT